jgi:general secretion pathway protein D
MPTRLAALLLTAGFLAAAAAHAQQPTPPAAAEHPRLVLTPYQVADLVIPIGAGKDVKTDEARLIKLIQDTVAPKSWASMGGKGTIDYFPLTMTLVINQAPDVQEQIADMLAALRRLQDTQVSLEVRVVTVPDAFFERVGVDFNVKCDGGQRVVVPVTREPVPTPCDKGTFLTDKQLAQFLEAAQGDQRTNVMQAPKITAMSGQTAVVDTTTKQTFVTGLDASRREGQLTIIPKTEEIATGLRMSARPVVSADRRHVQVELKVEQANLASTVVPLFPVTWQSGTADEPGKPVQFTQYIQQPVVNKQCVEGKVTIPDGGTVLLGGLKKVIESRNEYGPPVLSKIPYANRLFTNIGYGRETQNLYVLVTPRVIVTEEEECRPPACSRCKEAPACAACPRTAPAEESEPCVPVCGQGKALVELLKAYDEACAAGHKDEAAKLAQAALILDPTCFAKGRGR